MSALEAHPFFMTPLVTAEHAAMEVGASRFVWAPGGRPSLLDVASGTMLDLFEIPLTPQELAGDLVEVFGFEPTVASRSAWDVCYSLRMSGLLVPPDDDPRDGSQFFYPPVAST